MWESVEQSIPKVFEGVVRSWGSKRAIGAGGWQPTFAELNLKANQVAHFILANGGGTGDLVAILMRHDLPLFAVLLGVLKAGRVVLVLNTADPPARLGQVVEDTKPRWLFVDKEHEDWLPGLAEHAFATWCYDDRDLDVGLSADADANPRMELRPEAPAYLIFTSGSTGRPMGVIQNHRNLLHSVRGYRRRLGYCESDRVVLLGSLSGGQGMMTTFCALLNGATLYPYALRKRGAAPLADWVVKHKITAFVSSASAFRRFAQAVPMGVKLPHLRLIRLGAERTLLADLEASRRIAEEHCQFANVLSSSETGNVTQFVCRVGDAPRGGVIPIGSAVEGKHLMIMDENGQLVTDGTEGELVVVSDFLSPGYWNNPVATAQSFHMVPGSRERMFRMGDRGRMGGDGLIEHLGRRDRQQKLMGNRVDLRAIEEVLLSMPMVREAVVVVMDKPGGGVELCAWLVPDEGCGEEVEQKVRDGLRSLLPAYMVPGRIVSLPAIPFTANGKPDLSALRIEDEKRISTFEVLPRTRTEERIAKVWCEVLNRLSVGVYQNFFETGADSLQAVDLSLRLSKTLDLEIDAGTLIYFPTIAQMADAVDSGIVRQRREPWFRRVTASLLELRPSGTGTPLLVIPGGYTGEAELLVFMQLIAKMETKCQVFGIRLNLRAKKVIPPWSLCQLARKVGQSWHERFPMQQPVIVGECQASTLACETARWFAKKAGVTPSLILLDPWLPRFAPPNDVRHGAAMDRYYKLLRSAAPGRYPKPVHLVCSQESKRLGPCLEWWSARLGSACIGRVAPGDHATYLRERRADLARVLDEILSEDGAASR